MSARTVLSTLVSAEKSKSCPIRLTSRGRNSASSVWIRSPTSDAWRSPSNARSAAASPAVIACAAPSTNSSRNAPSSSRSATGDTDAVIFSSSMPCPDAIEAMLGFYAPCPKLAISSELTHSAMTDILQRYSLRPVRSSREWAAYHAIRRDAIFAALLPHETYDEHGSDELAPGHFPHLLLRDGEVLGTVRIDLIDEKAAGLRLIGIRPDVQRQGHGLRKKPRVLSAEPRSSSTHTQRHSSSTLPMGTARANGATAAQSRRASYGWENGCRERTSRQSAGARARQFQHRVETVT